ncbi:unnamed protein product, partial [Urochloa humidicola]
KSREAPDSGGGSSKRELAGKVGDRRSGTARQVRRRLPTAAVPATCAVDARRVVLTPSSLCLTSPTQRR